MNDNNMREVRFDLYCGTCIYDKLEGWKSPCNDCLEIGMNEGTDKPVCWKGKE